MIALLWKDLLVNRTLFLPGTIIVVVSFAAVMGQQSYYAMNYGGPLDYGNAAQVALLVSSLVSVLVFAACGSSLMSGERVTRNFEFLNYLPPHRLQILASKLLTGLLFFVLLCMVNLLLFQAALGITGATPGDRDWMRTSLLLCAIAALVLFGFAWSGSAFLGRTTSGFAVGIVLTLASYFLFLKLFNRILDLGAPPLQYYINFFVPLGALVILLGSYWFIRGIQP